MSDADLSLTAHLMRRAGFGATRDELEEYASKGYEAMVDNLVHPERFPDIEEDLLKRYYGNANDWIYRMVNTRRPLEEKIALFWHHVFATANTKSAGGSVLGQINGFRRNGLADVRTILADLSRDPAMIYWLDNNENLKEEPNENYGRELLELFSMGVGNYTEQDIKMAARAFTGWTITQPSPEYPYRQGPTQFAYVPEQHDDSVKTFLGETGRFNGDDIIDIIAKQPATARFISRHLYNFFVADEPQVSAWNEVAPQDPEAVDALVGTYFDSGGELRSMMRVLFNSDFFKEAQFKRVKSPAELVAGIVKLVGTYRFPDPGIGKYAGATMVMGQELMNPPTVEGWHTGKEWIDGGTLNERINFAVDEVGDTAKPGIRTLINRLSADDTPMTPQAFVDRCLDLVGPMTVSEGSRNALLNYAESGGELRFSTEVDRQASDSRVARMLQLIVSTGEYQLA